ncbi:putative uncharacterized protein DDB_G0282499 [Lucilia sericata]|uniref:putative uncharacterized protein DDB_G0282499 n=1 Tax=Lucilia sericata TaxID=13632 RepID=UPI0018A85996|nr:putative uncharacterized protein DDB_G0282499 [Lucilia sericata]
MDNIKQNMENPTIENVTPKKFPPLLTTQDCKEVLKQVANIYDVTDTTYAKPCQSYRNFKIHPNTLTQTSNVKSSANSKSRKKKLDQTDNESSVEKIRKLTNACVLENKENINPQHFTVDSNIRPLAKTKSIISPHLFETQFSDNTPPNNNLRTTHENNQSKFVENLQIDLTQDEIVISEAIQNTVINNENNSSCDSIECEEVRGLNENSLKDLQYICTPTKSILYNNSEVNTPRPTSCMNISDLNDSDMEITQVVNNQNFLMERLNVNNHENNAVTQSYASDMNITYPSNNKPNFIMDQQTEKVPRPQANNEVINDVPIGLQEILKDFEFNSDDNLDTNFVISNKQRNFNEIAKQSFHNNSTERDYYKDCVIFQKRIDNAEVSDSSEDDDNFDQFTKLQMNSNKHNNQNFIIMQNQPFYLNKNREQQNDIWTTPVKNDMISSNVTTTMATKCQVTPTAVIVQQIQVSAKKSVILRNKNSRKDFKANKSLNGYFQNMNSQNKQSMDSRREQISLQMKNSNQPKFTQLIYHKDPTNSKKNPPDRYYNKAKVLDMQQRQKVEQLLHLPIALRQQYSNLTNGKQIINLAKYDNPYETPSTNPATQTQCNDNDQNFEHRCSQSNSNITEGRKIIVLIIMITHRVVSRQQH